MCRYHVKGHGMITVVVLLKADYGLDIILSALHALFHLILFGCHIIAVFIPQTNT